MAKRIIVEEPWDVVHMPASADANRTYQVVFDDILGRFVVLPF